MDVNRSLTKPLTDGHDHAAEIWPKLDWLLIDDCHPLSAMCFEQFW
jgi:hypothetical protein